LDLQEVAATDSFLSEIGVTLDTVNGDNINFNLADLESFRDTRDLRQGLNKYAVILEEKLEKEEDVEKKAKLREYIRLCRSPDTNLLKGKTLTLGGSHRINNFSNNSFYGDLSAIMIENVPFWSDFIRIPSTEIALIEEFEE